MKKRLLRTMVAGATLVTMLAITACGNTETGQQPKEEAAPAETEASGDGAETPASSSAGSESQYDIIGEEYKIAWVGWGNTDYIGAGIQSYCEYLDEEMPEVTFVYSDAGARGSDAMVSEVEALCQSGLDAVIAYLPSAPMADVCKKYGVWLGAGTNLVSDQELLDYLEASGIWLGYCPHGDEEFEGRSAVETMYEMGDRNFVLIATDPGHPAGDARFNGMKEFLESKDDVTILGEYRGADGNQGLADLLALHGTKIDAVGKTSASQLHGLEGSVGALSAAGVDAHIAVTDVSESAAELFDSGVLAFMNGGDRIDAGVMIVPAINALQGNYEGPVYLYPNYVQMHSSEDIDEFFKYVENKEIPPFTADELRAWMKCYNPDATNEGFKEYLETEFTIENIAARHADLFGE